MTPSIPPVARERSETVAATVLSTDLGAIQMTSPPAATLARYDAGLLNDYGGGNVEWWWDYLRAELERAHDFYAAQTSPPAEGWRPEVRAFADLMEQQLRANDHKGGWKDCKPLELWRRIGEESHELFLEIWRDRSIEDPVPADPGRVGREAADVANFAMMIADVCGALPPPPAIGARAIGSSRTSSGCTTPVPASKSDSAEGH